MRSCRTCWERYSKKAVYRIQENHVFLIGRLKATKSDMRLTYSLHGGDHLHTWKGELTGTWFNSIL